MRILITGGLGFIGHHLSVHLKRLGHDVYVIDNHYHHITDERYVSFIHQRKELLKNNGIELTIADCRDVDCVKSLLISKEIESVVHLAATASASLCNQNPREAIDMGFMSFYNVLEAVRQYSKKVHFIYSSSSMVYGEFRGDDVVEETPLKPINIYGASKKSCETMLASYGCVYGIPWTIIRPSALYGPRCINKRVTQIFIENIIDDKPIVLAGDGQSKLDFTDVRDLTKGIALIAENRQRAVGHIFNLTYGQARPIRDLIHILEEEFGKLQVVYTEWDKNIPQRGTLSIRKIQDCLGYKPDFPIEIGYRDMIKWYKSLFVEQKVR